uniref:EF-hand domain-containing protein n=1 Tax=Eutreptiella gymnastica TaxID=73025 RepID=A0A7S4CTH6_9EUGL
MAWPEVKQLATSLGLKPDNIMMNAFKKMDADGNGALDLAAVIQVLYPKLDPRDLARKMKIWVTSEKLEKERGAEVDEHYWWQKYKEEDLTEVAQIYHLYLCTEDPETSPPDSPGTPAPLQFGLSQSGNQSFVPGPESPSRRPATPAQRPPSPVALPSALRDRQPDSGISLHQFKCGMAKGVLPEAFVEEVFRQHDLDDDNRLSLQEFASIMEDSYLTSNTKLPAVKMYFQ